MLIDRTFNRRTMNFVLLAAAFALGYGQSSSSGKVLAITPAKNADERLFLTYVLSDFYGDLPTNFGDDHVGKELDDLRYRTDRYYEYVRRSNLDADLTASFADLLQAIDAYTKFLAAVGSIQQATADDIAAGRVGTASEAGAAGGSAAASAYNNGASGGDVALAGLASAAITWVVEDSIKQHTFDRVKLEALEKAGQQLKDQLSSLLARLDNTEMQLTVRYGWGKCEARSSDSSDDSAAWQDRLNANDIGGLLKIADRNIAFRPRDPMLAAVREVAASCDTAATPLQMQKLAEQCVSQLSLVPSGSIYDNYRANILWMAEDIADRAFSKELDGRAMGTAHSMIAAYAVNLCDTLLILQPNDATGECRERRAWALMASGHLDDSVRQAKEIAELRGNTLRGALNMARLMNATGDTNASFQWFTHAVKDLHYNDIAFAWKDPDLAAMRKANIESFRTLVTANSKWNIEYGFFNDDIVLTNTSPFPITNAVLSCKLTNSNGTWSPVLNADVIQPGETYRWSKCVSIPGSRLDSSSATLSCDQNR